MIKDEAGNNIIDETGQVILDEAYVGGGSNCDGCGFTNVIRKRRR